MIVEDGTGVENADAYASVAFVDTYFTERPTNPFSAGWLASTLELKESAIVESSTYVDAVTGPYLLGSLFSTTQGLLFPRDNGKDSDGDSITLLNNRGQNISGNPKVLQASVAELSGRAILGPLAEDIDSSKLVTEETLKVGPYTETTKFANPNTGSDPQKKFGVIWDLLSSLMDGSQSDAPNSSWNWA